MERLKEEVFCARNPMNHRQVSRVSLSPDVVDCIVFWTKDPRPFLPYLRSIERLGYTFYFQFTLNAYGRAMEPGIPEQQEIIETFQTLAGTIGRERVLWRYDPIILTTEYDEHYHHETFHRLAEQLCPHTDLCTFSFLDLYAKTKRNLKEFTLSEVAPERRADMVRRLRSVADHCNLTLKSCCEAAGLQELGIPAGACIDKQRIERLLGKPLRVKRDRNQRVGCGCAASIDMGAYNTCLHGCRYCYANVSQTAVAANKAAHNRYSPLLVGDLQEGDAVNDRKG